MEVFRSFYFFTSVKVFRFHGRECLFSVNNVGNSHGYTTLGKHDFSLAKIAGVLIYSVIGVTRTQGLQGGKFSG